MDKEGWTWLLNSKKWHYFVKGRSLCGRWLNIGNPVLEQGKDNSPDNCSACRKALKKRKQDYVILKKDRLAKVAGHIKADKLMKEEEHNET